MNIGLEGYQCINKVKKYNRIFKMFVLGAENRFLMLSGVNPDPMKGIPQVDFLKNIQFNLIGP